MTTSPHVALRGAQRPRVLSRPPSVTSSGVEATELAARAGLVLDPWQAFCLDVMLGERADGQWSAFECALLVPRQNGKGSVIEALELAGLFLFGEQMILHSAHEFKTTQEGFRRVLSLVENTDDLRKRVKRVRTSHGEEGIELLSGARLRFVARTTGSGRGFSGDRVILDEAYNLSPENMAALLPTLSARPNPQIVYTSSAGMDTSDVLRALRERGVKGESKRLAYLEWSAEENADLDDPAAWEQANPALGFRLTGEFIEAERDAMAADPRQFARERLGIWSDTTADTVIPMQLWHDLRDVSSKPGEPVAFAVDVTPDRRYSSIAVAGTNAAGRVHVELVDADRPREGTEWVVSRVSELVDRWSPLGVVVDPGSAAGSLIADLEAAGVTVTPCTARDHAQACGTFYDDAIEGKLAHLGQSSVNVALAGALKRPLADAWAWDRKKSSVDISPLVAVTLARWGLEHCERPLVHVGPVFFLGAGE